MYPRQNPRFIRKKDRKYGVELRKSYSENIIGKQPVFPKPLEYEDIDKSFFDFVDKRLDITYDGKRMPTFTLFSNQRFSEYSQTWRHTDGDNNLLLNFKTIMRENNPMAGGNQGKLWNIPGERYYRMFVKDILEENGTESYEVYSMKQPYAVDLIYNVGIVTDKFAVVNDFNSMVNDRFKARQCYISPNGHNIPMLLDEISDNTSYSIDDRRIFVQTFSVRAMAYIIGKDDFMVQKFPKRIKIFNKMDRPLRPSKVDIEEYYNEKIRNKSLTVTVNFDEYETTSEFVIDTDMFVESIDKENIRNLRISVNGTPYYTDGTFSLSENDSVKIRIRHLNDALPSKAVLNGYDPNVTYDRTSDAEIVSDEPDKFEDIVIE